MKWTLGQLAKIQEFPYHIKDEIRFQDHISNMEDVLEISTCDVEGDMWRLKSETYRFELNIKVNLVIACALTLEQVPYPMNLHISEVYSTVDSEDVNPIINNTIDLDEIVWTSIVIEKPIRVVSDHAMEILKERGITLDEDLSKYVDDESDHEPHE
jgi:uncharacterized protein